MFRQVFIISWLNDNFSFEVERFIRPDEAIRKLKWLRRQGIEVTKSMSGKYVTRDIVEVSNLLEV